MVCVAGYSCECSAEAHQYVGGACLFGPAAGCHPKLAAIPVYVPLMYVAVWCHAGSGGSTQSQLQPPTQQQPARSTRQRQGNPFANVAQRPNTMHGNGGSSQRQEFVGEVLQRFTPSIVEFPVLRAGCQPHVKVIAAPKQQGMQ
jgi:hypothetical protein